MGVQDGQDVSAAITNPAFINKNIDDSTPSRLGLGSTASDQGPAITWAQQQFNSICSALGLSINQIYNYLFTWTNNYVGTSTDSVFARVQALVALFSGSTGHTHSGTDGQGPQIVASTLASVPLKGYGIQGTNYTSTAANSDNVTSLLTGKPVSSGPTVIGVVSTFPYNKTLLRNSTTGDDVKDALGNTVYGRLTFAASVWTHSYFSNIAGIETAYTFLSTTTLEWFFQQIFNPMNGAPTYDPGFIIPSANATADVLSSSTPTPGFLAMRDSNGNAQFIQAAEGFSATATAAGTTTLTVSSNPLQRFTGTTTQIVALPSASTLLTGYSYFVMNRSTGAVTVKDAAGTILQVMTGNTQCLFTCAANGSSAGTWDVAYSGGVSAGGGAGGTIFWTEDVNSPDPQVENQNRVYLYYPGQNQLLWTQIAVPSTYVAGSPIKMRAKIYSPDSSGTNYFLSNATLIRTGTDAISSTTNQRTSTNSAITLSAGTVNIPQPILLDLTDSTGNINGVAVSPGDSLNVFVRRASSDTGASPMRFLAYDLEVTFS